MARLAEWSAGVRYVETGHAGVRAGVYQVGGGEVSVLDWRYQIRGDESWLNELDTYQRTVTAPRNAEQALSLLSAGVGALTQVELKEDEKQRVWALIDKALDAVGEKR